jgi:citrate lyase subunit beta/citryl-CoA lyase
MTGGAPPILRSVLYVPGVRGDMLVKASRTMADMLQIDLEDSVTKERKDDARATTRAFAESRAAHADQLVGVKINPVVDKVEYSVASGLDDLDAVLCPGVSFVTIPKVEAPGEVEAVAERLGALEAGRGIDPGTTRVIALIESARGLLRAPEIAAASERVHTLAYTGETDFFSTLISARDPAQADSDSVELAYGRQHTAVACWAAGLAPPIDMPVIAFDNLEFLRSSGHIAKRLGFGGKLCVHPKQIAIVNEVFSPSAEEVDWAHRIVEALAEASARGEGAVAMDGRLVDVAMGPPAQRLIDRAQALRARDERVAGAASA